MVQRWQQELALAQPAEQEPPREQEQLPERGLTLRHRVQKPLLLQA